MMNLSAGVVRHFGLAIISVMMLAALGASAALAAPSDLDPTFGAGGLVKSSLSAGASCVEDSAIQSDGKILIAGSFIVGYSKESILARYNADGTPDVSFGNNGRLTSVFGETHGVARAVAIRPDGEILVAGNVDLGSGNTHFALALFNEDGLADTGLDGDGRLTTDFNSPSLANDMVLQANGKILLAGYSSAYSYTDKYFALVRYNANGSLDTTFSGDGKQTTSFGVHDDIAKKLMVMTTGRILVAGSSNNGTSDDFALASYQSNGTLDVGFSGDGKLTTVFGLGSSSVNSIAVQADAKIVLVGETSIGGNSDLALARYSSTGALDTTFNADGLQTTAIGDGDDVAYDFSIEDDGRYVVVGSSHNGDDNDLAVARYKANGALDATFSEDGLQTTSVGPADEVFSRMATQDDGKIVLTGYINNSENDDLGLARFNADWTIDSSFDGDGSQTMTLGEVGEQANDVATQADGKIVVVGSSSNNGIATMRISRYNVSDGSLDSNFDDDGRVTTSFKSPTGAWASSIAIQSNGKLVVAGGTVKSDYRDVAVARYNTDGSLDTSFDSDGKLTTSVGASTDSASAEAIAIQTDGKIVVAGTTGASGSTDGFLVRYNSDGSLDTGFDGDGKMIADLAVPNGATSLSGLGIQQDDKIVVAGTVNEANFTNVDIAVARFDSDGALDGNFDGDGKLVTSFGAPAELSVASSAAIQSDGNIIVAGSTSSANGSQSLVVRYLPDGQLDVNFDGDGSRFTTFGQQSSYAKDIVIQDDGKIVVAGSADTGQGPRVLTLARYVALDGSLDTSFDGDGELSAPFGMTYPNVGGLAIQPDKRLIVAGNYASGGLTSPFVARFVGDYQPPPPQGPTPPVVGTPLPLPPAVVLPRPTLPIAAITAPTRKLVQVLTGTAGPVGGVKKVEVALRRVDRRQLKLGKCLWLKNPRGAFAKSKAINKTCANRRFLTATGTESWQYKLEKRLAKGNYELFVRVTLTNGLTETTFSKNQGNLLAFVVR